MISCARVITRTVWVNPSVSKPPSGFKYLKRFIEAKLQAELSTCMYSLHGFEALIRPEFGQVCQSFIVVSNCSPGSPHSQAASAMSLARSLARYSSAISPVLIYLVAKSSSLSTALIKSSVTRTELLAFWYWIEFQASSFRSYILYPASINARTFFSSSAFKRTNFIMSGWFMFKTTILAARLVDPPEAIIPATESAPRIKEVGPDDWPPCESDSLEDRNVERLTPAPDPFLKMRPSVLTHSSIDSIESSTESMKQAEH